MNLKQEVYEILEKDIASRDSDDRLYQMILYSFHQSLIFQDQDGDWAIKLRNFKEAPSRSDCQRYRAYYQNDRRVFLPESEEVRRLRKIKEIEYHKQFSPSNPSRG